MKKLTIIPIMMLAGISLSQAAQLAVYTATGTNGNFNTTAFDSVDTEALTDSTRLVQDGGITGGGSSSFILTNAIYANTTTSGTGYNLAGVSTASRALAITAGDFFSFTVETNGNSVTFESLSFFQNQFGTTGKVDISATQAGGSEVFLTSGFTPAGGNNALATPATNVDFADFTTTADTTFTFYLYGASNANHGTRFDDITLNGTVVPEPSSTALLGLGGLALMMRRKK
ncbi:MAG: PEP-CTERM sorting domain-containing protein [Akkermansiaceae bacterium]